MVTCNICKKQFKTTQGLRGHNFFVHPEIGSAEAPAAQLAEQSLEFSLGPTATTQQRLSCLEQKLVMLEQSSGLGESGLGDTELPLTQQLAMTNQRVAEHAEQLAGLTQQQSQSSEQLGEVKEQLEHLGYGWRDAHKELANVVNHNSEVVNRSVSFIEDRENATEKRVKNLESLANRFEEQLQAKTASENELSAKVDAAEQGLTRLEIELRKVRNLALRQPTGEVVSVQLKDGRDHRFKQYKSAEGLTRPCRHGLDLLVGKLWIDLAEPED